MQSAQKTKAFLSVAVQLIIFSRQLGKACFGVGAIYIYIAYAPPFFRRTNCLNWSSEALSLSMSGRQLNECCCVAFWLESVLQQVICSDHNSTATGREILLMIFPREQSESILNPRAQRAHIWSRGAQDSCSLQFSVFFNSISNHIAFL